MADEPTGFEASLVITATAQATHPDGTQVPDPEEAP